jgi:hypothetical protein
MSSCRRYQDLFEEYLAGNISSRDLTDLEEHCLRCHDCAGLMELHNNLLALGNEIPMPEKHELLKMREAVLAASVSRTSFLADLAALWHRHTAAAGLTVVAGLAATALLASAIVVSQWNPATPTLSEELLKNSNQISTIRQAGFDQVLDSPYTYSNVSVRSQEQDQLALSFDASRHVDMVVPQNSALAREVLLQAILDPSSIGSRLRAMEVTPRIRDQRLKNALISTMLNDPDAAVRINALEVLARYPFDQNSRNALLQTLGQARDVQLRLTILEELLRQNVDIDTIRAVVDTSDPEGDGAYLRHATDIF